MVPFQKLVQVLSTDTFASIIEIQNSEQGVNILNDTPELCYLTQILLRLFEDNRRDLDDPRRFRVEILFSPGAEATPLHMHEQDRDSDPSRFDTAPLQMIGRDGLTCQELEDFFHAAIMEGDADGEETLETPTAGADTTANENGDVGNDNPLGVQKISKDGSAADLNEVQDDFKAENAVGSLKRLPAEESKSGEEVADTIIQEQEKPSKTLPTSQNQARPGQSDEKLPDDPVGYGAKEDGCGDDDDPTNIRNLERKYFWSTVAVGSFILAASCLVLALNLSSDSRRPRRYSTRRF